MPKFPWRCWIPSKLYQERKRIVHLPLMMPASQHAGLWAVRSEIVCFTILKLMFLVAVINLLFAAVLFAYIRLQLDKFDQIWLSLWGGDKGTVVMLSELKSRHTEHRANKACDPPGLPDAAGVYCVLWDFLRKILFLAKQCSDIYLQILLIMAEQYKYIGGLRLLRAQKQGHKCDSHSIFIHYIYINSLGVWNLC